MIKRVAKDSSLVVTDEAGVGAGGGVDTDRTVSKSTMFSYIAGIVLEFAVFVLEPVQRFGLPSIYASSGSIVLHTPIHLASRRGLSTYFF